MSRRGQDCIETPAVLSRAAVGLAEIPREDIARRAKPTARAFDASGRRRIAGPPRNRAACPYFAYESGTSFASTGRLDTLVGSGSAAKLSRLDLKQA
jgi:hypothetical protein